MLNLLVCGSRTITDETRVYGVLDAYRWGSGYMRTPGSLNVVSGGAAGVDTLARNWAHARQLRFTEYPAEWEKYGKRAGFVRNAQMVEVCQVVIAFWDGVSRGTAHTVKIARAKQRRVYVYTL